MQLITFFGKLDEVQERDSGATPSSKSGKNDPKTSIVTAVNHAVYPHGWQRRVRSTSWCENNDQKMTVNRPSIRDNRNFDSNG